MDRGKCALWTHTRYTWQYFPEDGCNVVPGLSSSDLEFFIWKNVSGKVKLTRAKECVDADVLKIVLNTFSQSGGANHSSVCSWPWLAAGEVRLPPPPLEKTATVSWAACLTAAFHCISCLFGKNLSSNFKTLWIHRGWKFTTITELIAQVSETSEVLNT